MATIRPVSHLQRRLGELTRIAQETGELVHLTKNGSNHLVLMDAAAFDELQRCAALAERPAAGRASTSEV